jgi:hypothetical protein
MPIPVKIAAAGGNTCSRSRQRVKLERLKTSRNYRPRNIENRRERRYDINSGIKPLCPLFVRTLSLVIGLDLGSKHG